MKSYWQKIPAVAAISMVALIFGATVFSGLSAWAEDDLDEAVKTAATSITISPVSNVLSLEANTTYENSFRVTNNSGSEMRFEVSAKPYSYTYSEETDSYQQGYTRETSYTQIVRWVSFKADDGEWVTTNIYTAAPGETKEVPYRVVTPSSIPAGGQYAVLFAHVLSDETSTSGIRVEANPGMVLYGRSTGETLTEGGVSNLEIHETMQTATNESKNIINATAKVNNSGNVDFSPSCTLRVTGIFGRVYYENTGVCGQPSVIPESEVVVRDSWDDTPFFGLFNVEWTVTAVEQTETITKTVLILPAVIIILMILLLTIVIVWIIILIRKRRERRSKFMV